MMKIQTGITVKLVFQHYEIHCYIEENPSNQTI
jgi:hypothetical protein